MQEAFILQCGRSRIYAARRCKADGRLWEGCGPGMPGLYAAAGLLFPRILHLKPEGRAAANGAINAEGEAVLL